MSWTSPDGAPDHEIVVLRRLPVAALAWFLGGLTVAASFVAVFAKKGLPDRADSVLFGILTISAMTAVLLYFPTVWEYLFGSRMFVLARNGFRFGQRFIRYSDIACLRHDHSYHATHIGLQDGTRIKLRWPIWTDSDAWRELLADQTVERLVTQLGEQLARGAPVSFGKKLTLDPTSVIITGRTIPIGTITFVHFALGADDGVDYRRLRIGTLRKTYEIDASGISNAHVFVELLLSKLETADEKNRTRTGRPQFSWRRAAL